MTEQAVGRPVTHMRVLGIRREHLIQYGIAAVTVVLVMAPLLPLIYQSLLDRPLYDKGGTISLQNYVDLFTKAGFGTVIYNTVSFAVLATIIAQVLGATTAILVGRTDVPGRHTLGDIFIWPLFISHLVMAFGWVMIYGPSGYVTLFFRSLIGAEPWNLYTIPGMALVGGISQAPLAYVYCLSSATVADPSLEDAARTVGAGPLRTLWSVTLPLLLPAVLYSALLNFTVSLEMLSIPIVFGEPVGITFFTTFLYTEGITRPLPNYGLVGTAAVLMLVIVTILVYLQNRLLKFTRRFVTVGGKATRPREFHLGVLRWPMFAFLILYALVAVFLPLGILFVRAFVGFLTPFIPPWQLLTLDHFRLIFSYPAYVRSITNTIWIAVIGGAMATVFIGLLALVVHRSEFPFRRQLEYVALFPRAIPGIIAGIGFFYAMVIVPPMGWLGNSIWILVLAYTMRYIPTAFGAIAPMLMQIGPEIDRSARTVGADWWTACQAILFRLLKPALFSSFALLFIHFFKEFVVAVFLYAPGSEVIGTTLLQFWVNGDTGPVSALSAIQIVLTALFIYTARKFLRVRIYG